MVDFYTQPIAGASVRLAGCSGTVRSENRVVAKRELDVVNQKREQRAISFGAHALALGPVARIPPARSSAMFPAVDRSAASFDRPDRESSFLTMRPFAAASRTSLPMAFRCRSMEEEAKPRDCRCARYRCTDERVQSRLSSSACLHTAENRRARCRTCG